MRIVIVGMALALALGSSALAGGKSSRPSHSNIPVTKQVDKATAKTSGASSQLFKNATTGKHYDKATLTVR
jgi:type VI protein secretion system component Hcp